MIKRLSYEKPAKGAFDILKALVILMLPTVHVIEVACWCSDNYGIIELSPILLSLYAPISALTVFGPSIFMICLGIGLAKGSNYKSMQRMGFQMLIISFILNVLRYFIPLITLQLIVHGSPVPQLVIYDLFGSDIYYFVGLFYILYATLRKHGFTFKNFVILSFILLAINCIISETVSIDNLLISPFLANFISGTFFPYFPLLGWCIYPCIGMLLEKYVLNQSAKQRNKIFLVIFVASGVVLLSMIFIAQTLNTNIIDILSEFADECKYGFIHFGLIISISLLTISLVYFVYSIIPQNRFEKFIISMSPLIFLFYLVQWILVSLVTIYLFNIIYRISGTNILVTLAGYIVRVVVVTALSIFITYKKGFTLSRWILKVTDYTKWFKKKKRLQ